MSAAGACPVSTVDQVNVVSWGPGTHGQRPGVDPTRCRRSCSDKPPAVALSPEAIGNRVQGTKSCVAACVRKRRAHRVHLRRRNTQVEAENTPALCSGGDELRACDGKGEAACYGAKGKAGEDPRGAANPTGLSA